MVLEGFKKFTDTGKSFRPKISIRTNGQIGFNAGAVKRFELAKWGYVVTYYNEDQKKMAIQLTNDGDANGAIRLVNRPNNVFFSGKSFLEFHDIKYDETSSYDVEWLKEENILIIDIGKKADKELDFDPLA